ncbi:MAG TPA: methyltransferase domain-containing protein [Gemmatimonadales bacterium]|nr:methyltransferase domain-containing protein [Gemmatimonadales bacterium]
MIARLRSWAVAATETLDDPRADARVVTASLRDIALINRAFGGAAAAVQRLAEYWQDLPRGSTLVLLDVGTGCGDIPAAAARAAARRGITLRLTGIDTHLAAARSARDAGVSAILARGAELPLRSGSADLVLCSKLLHHLPGEAGAALLRELNRVARVGVVLVDIRRSLIAAAGIFLASFPMRFHPATRRDSVISVLRGFTADELGNACARAGVRAAVRSHPGWTLTAAWTPQHAAP